MGIRELTKNLYTHIYSLYIKYKAFRENKIKKKVKPNNKGVKVSNKQKKRVPTMRGGIWLGRGVLENEE